MLAHRRWQRKPDEPTALGSRLRAATFERAAVCSTGRIGPAPTNVPTAFHQRAGARAQFNAILFDKLGLTDDPDFRNPYDPRRWAALRARMAAHFATHPRAHWIGLLEGTDACFAPVLTPAEAMSHPHMAARDVYSVRDGVLQAAPAPRFSATPSANAGTVPRRGEHNAEILRAAGLTESEIEELQSGA